MTRDARRIRKKFLRIWADAAMQEGASKAEAQQIAERVMEYWQHRFVGAHRSGHGPIAEARRYARESR